MAKSNELKTVDGRRLRSERSKQLILDACESLLAQGRLVPTAQMIADSAGVPIRTFFRHYPDMESLFGALDESLKPRYQALFAESVPEGTVSERVAAAISLRADSFESNQAILKSTKAQIWRYPILQQNYATVTKHLRKDLENRIPELKRVHQDAREMVHGLASAEMWPRLREYQKLSRARSERVLCQSIEVILQSQWPTSNSD